jgi:predicted ATPase
MSAPLRSWLKKYELKKFTQTFIANEVELNDLPHLTEDDLKELGLPLGPRRRFLASINSLETFISEKEAEPVLMVLEDAHWADPTTLALMELCLDAITNAPVLVLMTSRPDNQPEIAAHPHVTRLTLNRLARASAKRIVAHIGGGSLPMETLDAIIAQTDGVPLFVEVLTKAILETGKTSIPSSLHDSLMARLDRIPDVKEVAQITACIGREFDQGLLSKIVDLNEDELLSALNQLTAAELIVRRGPASNRPYLFKHALVRDAAYESLPRSRRESIHSDILTVLEKQSGAAPEILARHAEIGGNYRRSGSAFTIDLRGAGQPVYRKSIP